MILKIAFDYFDPQKIAKYDDLKVAELLGNPGIIRNRLKISATITNAKAYLDLKKNGQSFSDFLWQFVDGKTIQNRRQFLSDVPTKTDQSDAMHKALIKVGFKFVGSTICYAFMQASGMVNDHLMSCHRYATIKKIK